MEGQSDIVITYDTLFELLKREKDRRELQKLDAHFFIEVLAYLREKRKVLTTEAGSGYEESLKVQREMDNLRRIIKELYERREKKIVLMALDQSKTKNKLIDTSVLLKEERELYDSMTKVLDAYREGLLTSILNEQVPQTYTQLAQISSTLTPTAQPQVESDTEGKQSPITTESTETSVEQNNSGSDNSTPATQMVRFLHAVPKFVGPELEEYGPFVEDDIANLPSEIVTVLIQKERVEVVSEQ